MKIIYVCAHICICIHICIYVVFFYSMCKTFKQLDLLEPLINSERQMHDESPEAILASKQLWF